MAPSDEEPKRQRQDDANPFVLFRRFADEQMSTLMNSLFSISSLFGSSSTPPRRSVQDYEKWLQEARESSQRFARQAEEGGRVMDVHTGVHEELQHNSPEPAGFDDIEPPRCLYRPAEKEIPWPEKPSLDLCLMDDATRSSFLLAALSLRAPHTALAASLLGESLPSVPVAYLLTSPYSPVWLEQQPRLCDHDAKWREAFEDLLAVQSGQNLPPKCSQRTHESSFDWVRGMMHSAMCKSEDNSEESSSVTGKTSEPTRQYPRLLSLLNSLRQLEDAADEGEDPEIDDFINDDDNDDDDDDDELTELDLCDRICGSQQPSFNGIAKAAARSFSHLQPESSQSNTDDKTPSILSTLTTTERTTLQDGSVHTKIVLKKSFSDGREESTETVHHQNGIRQTQDAASKAMKAEDARKSGKDMGSKQNKSGGWFWS